MADGNVDTAMKEEFEDTEMQDGGMKEEQGADMDMDTTSVAQPVKQERVESAAHSGTSTPRVMRQSLSPTKAEPSDQMSRSPVLKEDEAKIGADVELKLEPGDRPKLVRKQSQKVKARPPQLFSAYADKTAEATSVFSVLPECVYANKYMGATDPALECECQEEYDASTSINHACGEDSDCINRATKMECSDDCGCGAACQNQRFQRKQYADVSVIKTEKKGYGLRANTDLHPNDFIFEYIGEVIGENAFRKRMQQYDDEGIKHFYFMSLTKGEFVDATKKGNLGRFCNHSCNPNCYVDKWVVGDKLRMGIFAERHIQAGEELVFNYNVDRYGAEPQPCYCGEPNCTGYIGGKTQTERGTKLSHAIIEALGIEDADAWDTAVAKKLNRKKKSSGDDDEEYVNNVEPKGLDEEGVNKVMSSLMQCKEKWIAVKLLTRIQRADDDKVRNRVVRFHGYRILKTALSNFIDDVNVCLQILDVLDKMPRLTRNKIQDSKIEETVQQLVNNEDERVASRSKSLLEAWAKLEVGYRIPRMKRDPNAVVERKVERQDRRDTERRRSVSRSKSPDRIQAPTGPRSNAPQRAAPYRPTPRFRPPPPGGALPAGWFEATAANGSVYYYNNNGATTWQRPTMPAANAPPPPPPKAVTDQQMISDLIANIVATKKETPKPALATATPVETPQKVNKEDRWRSWPLEKQKKAYESVLHPHITHCMNKYKNKLPRDELKQWAKELGKKMVESDFRKGRVENPTRIGDKQIKGIKKHCYEFFDKAVKKKEEVDKRRAEKKAKQKDSESHTPTGSPPPRAESPALKEEPDIELSEDEADDAVPTPAESSSSATAAKRRLDELTNGEADELIAKKMRKDEDEATAANAPPPPPPPPPPADGDQMETDEKMLTPNEDVSGSFTHEAISAVHGALHDDEQAEAGAEDDFQINGAALPKVTNGVQHDFMQTATPPTTGSPDDEEAEKAVKRAEFSGMNPDRMRQLGLFDGASE